MRSLFGDPSIPIRILRKPAERLRAVDYYYEDRAHRI